MPFYTFQIQRRESESLHESHSYPHEQICQAYRLACACRHHYSSIAIHVSQARIWSNAGHHADFLLSLVCFSSVLDDGRIDVATFLGLAF